MMPSSPQPLPLKMPWPYILLLLGISIIYAQTLSFEFVGYDDPDYVTGNARVLAGLSWDNVLWAFTTLEANFWHPLVWLSLMLDRTFFGDWAGGFHLTNVLIHMANTCLLYAWLLRIAPARWQAFVVAALFAWHPTHVESVAWVTERKDVLSAFFWIVALLAYHHYQQQRTLYRYAFVLGSIVLGMMAKPMLVTLPCVFLLLDLWPYRRIEIGITRRWRIEWTTLLDKIPLFALSAGFSWLAILAQDQSAGLTAQSSLTERLLHALYSYGIYLRQTFWPFGLASHYEFPESYPWVVMLGLGVLLMLLSYAALINIRRRPEMALGWFWFLGTLVPVIGLVRVGPFAHADRFLYLPHIGLFLALVVAGDLVVSRIRMPQRARWTWPAIGLLLAVALVALSARQTSFWKNSETLFQRRIALDDRDWRAYGNLGLHYLKEGNLPASEQALLGAIKLNSGDWKTANHYGRFLVESGRHKEAVVFLEEFVATHPHHYLIYETLTEALIKSGAWERAIQACQNYLRSKPHDILIQSRLASCYAGLKQHARAVEIYQAILVREPRHYVTLCNLGSEYLQVGRVMESGAAYDRAIQVHPEKAHAYYGYGMAKAASGQYKQAEAFFLKALERDPGHAEARHYLQIVRRSGMDR